MATIATSAAPPWMGVLIAAREPRDTLALSLDWMSGSLRYLFSSFENKKVHGKKQTKTGTRQTGKKVRHRQVVAAQPHRRYSQPTMNRRPARVLGTHREGRDEACCEQCQESKTAEKEDTRAKGRSRKARRIRAHTTGEHTHSQQKACPTHRASLTCP